MNRFNMFCIGMGAAAIAFFNLITYLSCISEVKAISTPLFSATYNLSLFTTMLLAIAGSQIAILTFNVMRGGKREYRLVPFETESVVVSYFAHIIFGFFVSVVCLVPFVWMEQIANSPLRLNAIFVCIFCGLSFGASRFVTNWISTLVAWKAKRVPSYLI